MDLKDIVCSIKSAKALKEIGVKQDSIWYWFNAYHGEPAQKWKLIDRKDIDFRYGYQYSAFTSEELIGMIPLGSNTGISIEIDSLCKDICLVDYIKRLAPKYIYEYNLNKEDSIAEGLAKALIYITQKNNIIS